MRASHFLICFQINDTTFSWHSNSQRANFIEQFFLRVVTYFKTSFRNITRYLFMKTLWRKISFLVYIFRVSFDFQLMHIRWTSKIFFNNRVFVKKKLFFNTFLIDKQTFFSFATRHDALFRLFFLFSWSFQFQSSQTKKHWHLNSIFSSKETSTL